MEDNIKPSDKSNLKIIGSAILVAAVLVAGAMLLRGTTPPKKHNTMTLTDQAAGGLMPITKDDHVLGNPNASIVIVEYSDTECPFCKRFHETMHALVDSNEDVAWVYRHFPIASLHPKAFREALATECAAEQGGNEAFWTYTDQVYTRTNSNNSLDPNELYVIAADMNLNEADFKECLDTERYAGLVQSHMADGSKNGVQGTPTSFIIQNGEVIQTVPGAIDYTQLSNYIDGLLN